MALECDENETTQERAGPMNSANAIGSERKVYGNVKEVGGIRSEQEASNKPKEDAPIRR